MKLTLLTLTILLIFCSAKTENKKVAPQTKSTDTEMILGERIDEHANMKDSLNSKILFTLNDNALIQTTPTKDKWLQFGLFINLTEIINDDFPFFPKTDLISIKGEIFGKTGDSNEV